jgi:hypothetical protein
MRTVAIALALTLAGAVGCAGTPPPRGDSASSRQVPAKCTACHLAPREHSLQAERWPAYLKAHERRLRLSEQDRAFLYDFLVGGTPPP